MVCQGNLEGGSFTWDPEGYEKEGSGNRYLSPLGPCWGTGRGDHWLGTFRDGQKRAQEIFKRRLWQQATLSTGVPLGNLEEKVHLPGILRYRNIWALFLDPENIRSLSLGVIWNFSKGLGFPMTWNHSMEQKGAV